MQTRETDARVVERPAITATHQVDALKSTRRFSTVSTSTCALTDAVARGCLAVAVIGSLGLRLSLLPFESDDYHFFFGRWFDFVKQNGGWLALKQDFSDYPPLYLYLLTLCAQAGLPKMLAIKVIPIICDYVAALLIIKILGQYYRDAVLPISIASIFVFSPTIFLNSALWGQCDSIYTTALLWTFYSLLLKRPMVAFVAYGFATALKPQSVFLLPFLSGLLLLRAVSLRHVASGFLVYLSFCLPMIWLGKPVLATVFHYATQTNLRLLAAGVANPYQWVSNDYYSVFSPAGTIVGVSMSIALCLLMLGKRGNKLDRDWLLAAATTSLLTVPYFLPGMHERYFYAADVFSILFATRFKHGWIAAVCINSASFFSYLPYLFHLQPVPRILLPFLSTIALVIVAVQFIRLTYNSLTMTENSNEGPVIKCHNPCL